MDMPAIDNLKQLYASGLLDAGEFTRLATELSQQSQNASHSGAGPSQLQQAEPAEEDEMLVDEDGIPLQQPSSARSSQHAPSSPEEPSSCSCSRSSFSCPSSNFIIRRKAEEVV